MKKLKGFTLVEILIVIVIIGILIGALVPRMQSAQGRARDVARKNDLAQLQSAIVTSQQDRGNRPGMDTGATGGIPIQKIEDALLKAGMSSIPADPLSSNTVSGLGGTTGLTAGQYGYIVTTRNGTSNGGFVLMAKTEIEGGSNWVVCETGTNLTGGVIKNTDDIKNIHVCTTVSEASSASGCDSCHYKKESELRYILLY